MTASDSRSELRETFVRIAEAGNLSAAAKQLGVSQPTVSRRLRALEDALGVRLVQRTTHAMQLTEQGQRYAARAKELLRDWEQLDSEVRGEADAPEGTLRVVAPTAFGQQRLLTPALDYQRKFPKVTLEWILSDGPVRFVEDNVDCLLRVGRIKEEAVIARRLFDVQRIVVAAPSLVANKPALTRPAQLAALPWLAFKTFYRNTVKLENDRGTHVTVPIRPHFITDNVFALRTAALSGMGVAVISQWAVEDDLARGALVHILPHWHYQPLPVYIAYPQLKYPPAKLRAFVAVLREAFPLALG